MGLEREYYRGRITKIHPAKSATRAGRRRRRLWSPRRRRGAGDRPAAAGRGWGRADDPGARARARADAGTRPGARARASRGGRSARPARTIPHPGHPMFDIHYDDGEDEARVRWENMRVVSGPTKTAPRPPLIVRLPRPPRPPPAPAPAPRPYRGRAENVLVVRPSRGQRRQSIPWGRLRRRRACRVDIPWGRIAAPNRGTAAAAAWIFRGEEPRAPSRIVRGGRTREGSSAAGPGSRLRRACHVDIPWGRVAAAPRMPRG